MKWILSVIGLLFILSPSLGRKVTDPTLSGPALPIPYNLQCDHNLVGLSPDQLKHSLYRHYFATDNPLPLLSWSIGQTVSGVVQESFRVQVSTDVGFDSISNVWDSDIVPGNHQYIKYNGPILTQGQLYYWNVTWWDQHGHSASSIEVGHFLSAVNLKWENVSWIYFDNENAQKFTRTVELEPSKKVTNAVFYISGLGLYRASVNGQDLLKSDEQNIHFVPGWTNYEIHVGYQVYLVTDFVNLNSQVLSLEVWLGEGWRDRDTFLYRDDFNLIKADNHSRVLRAQLVIEYDNSSPLVIKTDELWNVSSSKFMNSSIYNGESYNASQAESDRGNANITTGPNGKMYLAKIPNIVEIEYDSPVAVYRLHNQPDMQIVDFGVNTAGIVNLNVSHIPKGRKIIMKHSEVLTHPPYGAADGSLYFGNLRKAMQQDVYISSGRESFYQPQFTYHGFQYVSVSGYTRNITNKDIKRVRISTGVKRNSNFTTSIPLVNKLQENVLVSHMSNLMTVQTDCDQRDERLGTMVGAELSSEAMALNFHLESYLAHRALVMRDEMINGSLPDVTPYYQKGMRPSDPSWSGAYPQTLWTLLKYYGDIDTCSEHIHSLLHYITFLLDMVSEDELKGAYGDWHQPPEYESVDASYVSAFSVILSIQQVAEITQALGHNSTVSELNEHLSAYIAQFNDKYFHSNTYIKDLQVSYALPFYLGIVPTSFRLGLASRLINLVSNTTFHTTSGIIGTKFILPVLSSLHHAAAVQMVSTIDYPSYGYMLHNPFEPATSLWELWNTHRGNYMMDSRNHHSFSSVSSWMQTDMIGFQQMPGTHGYTDLNLSPALSLDISAGSIELEYPKPIKYSWQRNGGVQCAKAAEDWSELNPGLPKHGGLFLTCGLGGEVVSEVLFASYGNSTGTCGYQRYGTCHSIHSISLVEKFCLNKTQCTVPTGADLWGDPCPGEMDVKWLTVAIRCASSIGGRSALNGAYSSISVNVSIPLTSQAILNLPAYGSNNVQVSSGDFVVFNGSKFLPTEGVKSVHWVPEEDVLRVSLRPGVYNLMVFGNAPNEIRLAMASGNDTHVNLQCSKPGNVISTIDWASYGNPVIDPSNNRLMMGFYHSEASVMISKNYCVGHNNCTIPMEWDLFFASSPFSVIKDWRFIIKYFCNHRLST